VVSTQIVARSLPVTPQTGTAMPRQRENRPPLTKWIVDAALPRERRHLVFDGLVHGLALKVEPSGAKVWMVQKSQLVVRR
jgi:hypothetical protein